MKKLYPGNKEDSDFFGGLIKVVGGILLSFGIVEFINSLEIGIFKSIGLIAGLGYLFYSLGFLLKKEIKKRSYLLHGI